MTKTYAVAGAAGGIELTIFRRLVARGVVMRLVDIDADDVPATAAAMKTKLAKGVCPVIRDEEAIKTIFWGGGDANDGLVNNASISGVTPFETMDMAQYRKVTSVKLEGAACQRAGSARPRTSPAPWHSSSLPTQPTSPNKS